MKITDVSVPMIKRIARGINITLMVLLAVARYITSKGMGKNGLFCSMPSRKTNTRRV